MNYQFLIEQFAPENKAWHFVVWIDIPTFIEECKKRAIEAEIGHPKWPYDVHSWQGIIHDAAVDAIHDKIGIGTTSSFDGGSTYSHSEVRGPFKRPTARHAGFELLLLS